jgi:hypothetical protein
LLIQPPKNAKQHVLPHILLITVKENVLKIAALSSLILGPSLQPVFPHVLMALLLILYFTPA